LPDLLSDFFEVSRWHWNCPKYLVRPGDRLTSLFWKILLHPTPPSARQTFNRLLQISIAQKFSRKRIALVGTFAVANR